VTARLRRLAQWTVSIALAGYVVWFVVDRREAFSQQFAGTTRHAVLLGLGVIATWTVNSLQTLLPLRELGVRVGFWENWLLTLAAGFGNYLPMRAGTVLRMHYIRSVHGVGYLQYGGILGTRALLLLWAAGGLGLGGAIAMALAQHTVRIEIVLLFAAILVLGVAPFVLPLQRVLPSGGRGGQIARQLIEAIDLVRRNRRMTVWYLGLIVLQFGILTARLSVAFDVIQHRPAWWVYFFLSPVATILSFINITPGNLGLREWLIGVLSAGVGADYAAGIFAAAVDRVVMVAMTLSAGALAAALIAVRLGRPPADSASS
jgi:hypothetical protein